MLCLVPKGSSGAFPPRTIELVAVASPFNPNTVVLFTPLAISFELPLIKQLLLKPLVVFSVPFT